MDIVDFPLAWRWVESNTKFPTSVLNSIHPMSVSEAKALNSLSPTEFTAQAIRLEVKGVQEVTSCWLKSLPVPVDNISIVWSDQLAVCLPLSFFLRLLG